MTPQSRERIHLATVGVCAAATFLGNSSGRIVAIYENSVTVDLFGGRFMCICAAGMGDGPINAICSDALRGSWASKGFAVGQSVEIVRGAMHVAAGPIIDAMTADVWKHPPWPLDWTAATLQASLQALDDVVAGRVPSDGLARVALADWEPAGPSSLNGAMLRAVLNRTATISHWLAAPPNSRTSHDAAARAAVHRLIGLGPGLTPSGDDVMAGMLIALHATGQRGRVEALAGFVAKTPVGRTSPLSRVFLEVAGEGLPSAAMHAVIDSLLAHDVAALPEAVERLTGIGHTSGWDMLAGAVLGLRAVAADLRPPCPPAPRS